MNTKTPKTLFVVLAVLAVLVSTLACGGGSIPLPFVEVGLGDPDATQAAPAAPQATEVVPAATAQINTPAAQAPAQPEATCRVVNDYQLKDLTEVSSQPGSLIHIEWYERDGQPEYESVLPSGRYSVEKPFPGGHVWEYAPNCSLDEVLDQVSGHIARRLQNLANNKGYRPWTDLVDLGFISQVTSTSSVVVPDKLP